MARWVGYCAPGRKPWAELQAADTGVPVIEIREAPVMAGHSEVILINHDAENDLIRESEAAPALDSTGGSDDS